MDIPGLRQQILANATQAIAFRFPEHDPTRAPVLLTHRSGDAVKAVLLSTDAENLIVRPSGEEADSSVGALQSMLMVTEAVLEQVINAWDARGDAVMQDDDAKSEVAAPATQRKVGGLKQEAIGAIHDEEEEETKDDVVPSSTKRKPGRPKKVFGKRGRPRKSVA